MASSGYGDVRRVLGDRQPQGWIAQNFPTPQPEIPRVHGDRLYDFLSGQLTNWESQVAIEAREYHLGPNGAAVLRWAQDIRRHSASVRRILVRYAEAREANSPELPLLRGVLADIAASFSRHPDWREDWGEPRDT